MSTKSYIVAATLTAALSLFVGTSVSAEVVHWNGAGWYGVADVVDWGWIINGPFADEQSCNAQLPANDDETEYYCEYLGEKPGWD